jgi:hypothetical protein
MQPPSRCSCCRGAAALTAGSTAGGQRTAATTGGAGKPLQQAVRPHQGKHTAGGDESNVPLSGEGTAGQKLEGYSLPWLQGQPLWLLHALPPPPCIAAFVL